MTQDYYRSIKSPQPMTAMKLAEMFHEYIDPNLIHAEVQCCHNVTSGELYGVDYWIMDPFILGKISTYYEVRVKDLKNPRATDETLFDKKFQEFILIPGRFQDRGKFKKAVSELEKKLN